MTKQEKIQEAYGYYWESVKYSVDENGWCNCRVAHELAISGNQEDSDCGYLVRPKSLNGIEDNNGWIKIESENDLPKSEIEYLVNRKDIQGAFIRQFVISHTKSWIKCYTHYQSIIKPKPPIY